MKNILAIWQRELSSYFVSPIAYVVLTIFLLVAGLFLCGGYIRLMSWIMERSMYGQDVGPMDMPAIVMMQFYGAVSVVLLLMVPLLTMGLFAEEKKRGTIELLLTTPVSNLHMIFGKYLASLSVVLIMFLGSLITISGLFIYGQPDWRPILAGYLGLLLYAAALLAAGLFISTLTENQIVAGVISFGIALFLLLVELLGSLWPAALKDIFSYVAINSHLDDFFKGVIDTTHVVYYVTFAFFALFLSYRSLESLRWKS